MNKKDFELKLIFSEILNGYSSFDLNGQGLFIKHLNLQEKSKLDSLEFSLFQEAERRNLPCENEREKHLIKKGHWSKENKTKVDTLKLEIQTLSTNLEKKIYRKQEVSQAENQLKENKIQLSELLIERASLMGITAQDYIRKKIDEYYVVCSIYENEELTKPKYQKLDLENIEEEELAAIYDVYKEKLLNFTPENMKEIALFPNFFNIFYLVGDDISRFYSKSVLLLSTYQIELYSYSRYYKSLIERAGQQPPSDIREIPEELELWCDSIISVQESARKNNTSNQNSRGNTTIPIDGSMDRLLKEKGSISMQDMLKSRGINMNG